MTQDSFTNQKPRTATERDLKAEWGFGKPGERFRCYLCGYKFKLGDYWRWVYGGAGHHMNIIVCKECDGENVLEKWDKAYKELKQRFWWAID